MSRTKIEASNLSNFQDDYDCSNCLKINLPCLQISQVVPQAQILKLSNAICLIAQVALTEVWLLKSVLVSSPNKIQQKEGVFCVK